jgi:hypothetical protein
LPHRNLYAYDYLNEHVAGPVNMNDVDGASPPQAFGYYGAYRAAADARLVYVAPGSSGVHHQHY